jgi:hypothetical protein
MPASSRGVVWCGAREARRQRPVTRPALVAVHSRRCRGRARRSPLRRGEHDEPSLPLGERETTRPFTRRVLQRTADADPDQPTSPSPRNRVADQAQVARELERRRSDAGADRATADARSSSRAVVSSAENGTPACPRQREHRSCLRIVLLGRRRAQGLRPVLGGAVAAVAPSGFGVVELSVRSPRPARVSPPRSRGRPWPGTRRRASQSRS